MYNFFLARIFFAHVYVCIRPGFEYCRHVKSGASDTDLEILHEIKEKFVMLFADYIKEVLQNIPV